MQLQFSVSILCMIAVSAAAPVSSVASTTATRTWTTLTPSGSAPSGALTDFDGLFALSIKTLSAASETASVEKRDEVVQISDGQIQAQTTAAKTASVINQISDGQIQQQTTADVVNQISDGQIQKQSKTTAEVVNQISDGQIQHQTKTTADVVNQISDGQIQHQTADVINQISDGQIQQQTKTADVVNQISDGQIQQQSQTTASVVNQISDGQIQQTTKTTASAVNQISDGQIQQTTAAGQATQVSDGQPQVTDNSDDDDVSVLETCVSDDALTITLTDGELTDSYGRVGAIVANRQFQFDGPPPQAGTIYAAGWSLVPSGETYKLALGDSTTFYKCLSGDFYNLYDQSIGGQCDEIEIDILKIVDC